MGIAVYRFDDYKNAGIPILPVARSIFRTKVEKVLIYVSAVCCGVKWFVLFWLIPICFFLSPLTHSCAYWVYLSIIGFKAENDQVWAKRYFLYSVILITALSFSFSFSYVSHPAPTFARLF